MQSSKYLIWALALSFPLQVVIASPAPSRSIHGSSIVPLPTLQARDYVPLLIQIESWPADHYPALGEKDGSDIAYDLPLVSDVFKALIGDSPSLPTSPVIFLSPTTTISAAAESTGLRNGPGLVIVTTPIADPESSPPPVPTSTASTDINHKAPAPVRKLVVIAGVMAGMIGLTFFVYLLVNQRILGACWRAEKKSPRETWMKYGFNPDKEKEVTHISPWLKCTPSPLNQDAGAEVNHPRYAALPPSVNKVIDIAPGFPRSKFSVTSSDYPFSVASSARTSSVSTSPMPGNSVAPSPLLPPYEFFCLPSAPDLQDQRHSRAQSAPIFCHQLPVHALPDIKIRSGDHRRSKSVSGLAYVVEPSKPDDTRDVGSGEWKEGSENGVLFSTL